MKTRATKHARRILHVGPLPPPVGGMATVVESLVVALSEFHEVNVLNNAKTTSVNRSLAQAVGAQLRLLQRLAVLCLVWRPQIVHIHTCSWLSFWRSSADVVLARLLCRRVVLHIHGAEFNLFLKSLPPLKARMARLVFGACSKVIVLGPNWKDLLDCWCARVKVVTVPNGVAVLPKREKAQGDFFLVLCLANYERRKGQADLLQAVTALGGGRPIRVALLGFETEAGQQQDLKAQAAELGLALQVEIPGPVTGAEKDSWWARADCFCLPSYNEGLPMSMLEAMARGVPVIASRVGSIPLALEDRRDGLLYDAGDISALTSCLQQLMNDPAKAEEIGNAGRSRLIRDFTLEQSVRRLLSLYCDLMPATG